MSRTATTVCLPPPPPPFPPPPRAGLSRRCTLFCFASYSSRASSRAIAIASSSKRIVRKKKKKERKKEGGKTDKFEARGGNRLQSFNPFALRRCHEQTRVAFTSPFDVSLAHRSLSSLWNRGERWEIAVRRRVGKKKRKKKEKGKKKCDELFTDYPLSYLDRYPLL